MANVQQTEVSANIRRLLGGLRWRIRTYVFLEGLLLAVVWVALTFIAELLVDYGLVVVGATELPWAVRFVALLVIVGVLGFILYRWILRRTFVRLADHSMAVLLERRFVDFRDSLVTTVEMAEHPDHAEQFNLDMLVHTTDEAKTQVGRVRLSRVFNLFPLVFSGVAAIVLATPIALYAGFLTPHFLIGVNRIYLLSNEPWPRRAHIEVLGVDVMHASMRTGEVRTQHLTFDKHKTVKVSKGANVELQVLAYGGRYEKPETLEFYYRTEETSDRATMTPMKSDATDDLRDDLHIYAEKPLHGVLSSIAFDVRGGDHRLSGYRIEVVDPPVITGAELDKVFPKYMVDEKLGLNTPRTETLTPGTSVPLGTKLTVRATSSKPIKDAQVRVATSGEELRPTIFRLVPLLDEKTGKSAPVTIAMPPLRHRVKYDRPGSTGLSEETVPVSFSEPVAVFDRKSGKRISVLAVDKIYYLVDAETGNRTPLDAPLAVQVDVPVLKKKVDGVLQPEVKHRPRIEVPIAPLEEDLMLDIHLHDTDDVLSEDPHKLFVATTVDTAPDVNVLLRGIGTLVTPNVLIPVKGKLDDDYGLASAWFEYQVGDAPPRRDPITIGKGGEIEASMDFDLKQQNKNDPVILRPEQTLTVSVKADDHYDLAGPGKPNVGSGDRYQLKVVTEDQLLAYLARQEQTMREILEHARDEMSREHDAMLRSKTADALGGDETTEPGEPGDSSSAEPDDKAPVDDRPLEEKVASRRLLRVQQALLQGGKSMQEVRGAAEGFASIRLEMVNNRLDAKDHMDRLQYEVYDPLIKVSDEMFPALERLLVDLEKKVEKPKEYVESSPAAIAQMEAILVEIDEVLTKLEKFEGYNELVEILRRLINQQNQIMESTKTEQANSVLKELQDLSN